MGRWRAAGAIAVSTVTTAGCLHADSGQVATEVKAFESAAEVNSCREIGDAITDAEDAGTSSDDLHYSASLAEVWKCSVRERRRSERFVDACYVVGRAFNVFVYRKVPCESVHEGCPLGSRRDRGTRTAFLGRIRDVEWIYEAAIGDEVPPYETVRVEVYYQAAGAAKEHCGYLDVWVPVADDAGDPSQRPRARAAEQVKAQWTDDPRYSFSYSAAVPRRNTRRGLEGDA